MRRSEQAGIWQQLRMEAEAPHLNRVLVRSSPVLAPQTIDLGRFTVLTGTHGVGKSYLLRVLSRTTPLTGHYFPQGPPYLYASERYEIAEPLQGAFQAEYRTGDEFVRWSLDLTKPDDEIFASYPEFTQDDEPWTSYVDPSVALSDVSFFNSNRMPNIRFSEAQQITKTEPARLRQILGKSYEHLSWKTWVTDDLELPFFNATVDGHAYTSDTMSMAELWVHYVLWVLRSASSSSIVLIDEPETFLSPTGHAAFLNEIARKALESKAQVVVATHSTAMIAATPLECLRVITAGVTGAKVSRPSTTASALRILGLEPAVRALVIVEDDFAALLVTRTLGLLAPDIAGTIDVVPAGGSAAAIAAGRALMRSSRLGVCVVLDGDQRDRTLSDPRPPLLYLPGDAPEIAISAPSRSNPSALADRLGRTVDAVEYALDGGRFHDHHDWFSAAARALEISREALVDGVILVWLTETQTSEEGQQLAAGIRAGLQL
ncbi:AAA family ATPase [Kribbella sp. NPDC003557]|uniref:AAA family ATPase n=1 Tax=Kribbella sp. NPDC003557 TaxID=3154449 RepID=UPI0033A286FF